MSKIRYIFLLLILLPVLIHAQNDTIKYEMGFMGVASSGKYAPFWLQSDQYGKISSSPFGVGVFAGVSKDFGTKKGRFDYRFKANLLLQTDKGKATAFLHEYYVQARFSVFDLTVGAREEQLGSQDSALSCGGLLFSKNARPMPKITFGMEHFTAVPFTYGLLEVKGAISHGWFTDNIYASNVLLHHKYLYGRIGGQLPVHIQYGVDHVAQWGGSVPGYGKQPTNFAAFKDIFFSRSGGADASTGEQLNTLGNHIVSQHLKLDVDISDFRVSGYWQNLSEDGPVKLMWYAVNKADGLWGVTVRNAKFPFVKGILYEYLNTTDQSGPYHDKDGLIFGGSDSYFNNYIYVEGWTFHSRIIGTPFISSPIYNKDGTATTLNSRVQVHHIGVEGDVLGYSYRLLTSISNNYGTYYVPLATEMRKNTSVLLEVKKQFPGLSNIELGCSVGADFGKLYGNSVGCLFSIRKIGNLFRY